MNRAATQRISFPDEKVKEHYGTPPVVNMTGDDRNYNLYFQRELTPGTKRKSEGA
jgi:hypothetical protein